MNNQFIVFGKSEITHKIGAKKFFNYNLCIRQCHKRHYKLGSSIFIEPPVALTEEQVVILIFRVDFVSSNRIMSEILVQ